MNEFILNNEGVLILILFVSVAVAFLAIVFYIRRAVLLEFKSEASDDEKASGSTLEKEKLRSKIKGTFSQYTYVIKSMVTGQQWRYAAPWYLMLGKSDSGKASVLESLDLRKSDSLLLKSSTFKNKGCNWWLFNKGIILDVGEKYFASKEGTGENKVWSLILNLIQRCRPKRPIDGIILTISAEELEYPESGFGEEGLIEKGELVYRDLLKIQKQFGFIVPVYVLVTQCGKLSGFEGFWRPFAAKRESEIVGWSNPHTLDTSFAVNWMDQAYKEIRENLNRIQLEMAASAAPIEDIDGFFIFPQELGRTQKALSIYLDSIFKPTVYHESFYFRGVYFSGQLKQPADNFQVSKLFDTKSLFINDLFQKKIFPEKNLARPASKTLVSNNRIIRRLQFTAVALALGLSIWVGLDSFKLKQDVDSVTTTLADIKNIIQIRKNTLPTAEESNADQERLFRQLEQISSGTFRRAAFPSSNLVDLDSRITEFFSEGFQKIIFNIMHLNLTKKANDLGQSNQEESDYENEGGPTQSMFENGLDAEVQSFQKMINQVIVFENTRAIYNDWPGRGNLKSDDVLENMGLLVKYLLGFKLNSSFTEDSELYSQALKLIRPIPYPDPGRFPNGIYPYRANVIREINQRADYIHNLLTKKDLIYSRLSDITFSLKPYGEMITLLSQSRMVAKFVSETKKVDALLASPLWAGLDDNKSRFKYCQTIQDDIRKVITVLEGTYAYKETKLLKSAIRDFDREHCDQRISRRISGYKVSQLGPILISAEKGGDPPAFSPKVDGIRLMLKKISVHSFLKFDLRDYESFELQPDFPPGQILSWDTDLLSEAIKTHQEYQKFLDEDLKAFPAPLTGEVENLALEGVLVSIHDLLVRAQKYSAQPDKSIALVNENTVASQIENLNKSSKLLLQLIDVLTKLHSPDTRSFAGLVRNYAVRLIDQVDLLSQANPVYASNNGVNEWKGSPSLLAYAYLIKGKNSLENYLKSQRDRIIYISDKYVQPVFSLLQKLPKSGDAGLNIVTARWQATLSDVNAYKSKDLSSKLAGMEEFFRSTLLDMDKENCSIKLSQAKGVNYSDDIFSGIWLNLNQQLFERCGYLVDVSFEKNYNLLAGKFNQLLKGKYPFTRTNLNDQNIEEVDPIAVQTFYNYFDSIKKELGKQIKNRAVFDPDNNSLLKFFEQVDEAGKFFQHTFIPTSQGANSQINLNINFKPLPSKSTHTNQVIEWVFASGSQKVEYLKGPPKVAWESGQPISLQLQWAMDSPQFPGGPIRIPNGPTQIEGNKVHFSYSGTWALIKFLQSYPAPSYIIPGGRNADPHVLEMVVPLAKRKSKQELEDKKFKPESTNKYKTRAKIHLRLELSATNAKTSEVVNLILPNTFPYQAPLVDPNTYSPGPSVDVKQITNIKTSSGDKNNKSEEKSNGTQALFQDSALMINIGDKN